MDFLEDDLADDITDEQLIKLSEAAEDGHLSSTDSTNPKKEPGPEHLQVLSKYFGHTNFRPLQWEIISAILIDRRDVCAVMCTGYGKSLCFQFPAVFTGGITLVISPLIALMEDQVLALQVANIPACLLGTAQTKYAEVVEGIFKSQYNLIYLTPEFCTGETGMAMLRRMSNELNVTLIAVDEAHCISSWGHDFRFSYRKLDCLHYVFPSVPVIAMTATATTKVRDDIVENLKLRNPLTICSGFDRPNLYFEVHRKGEKTEKAIFQDLTRAMVYRESAWKFSGPTIVYCITRNQTVQVSEILQSHGVKSRPYHAGMPLKVRKETHEQFVRDQIDVVVATIAFGMGIDKPDIANIVHYGASKSIENYYQEVGRAGRDGNPARCVAFFSDVDFFLHRMIDEKSGTKNTERKEGNLRLMEEYLNSRQCRRRFILNYFDDSKESTDEPLKNCCDNCTKRGYDRRTDQEKYEELDEQGRYDYTDDARILLEAISSVQAPLGLTTYIALLRGSCQARTQSYKNHPLFGAGKHKTVPWWKAVAKILTDEKYITEVPQQTTSGYDYVSFNLTENGTTLLNQINRNKVKFLRAPPPHLLKVLKKKPQQGQKQSGWLSVNSRLNLPSTSKSAEPETPEVLERKMKIYNQLLSKRTELAAELDCMPYMVASNAALMEIAAKRPKTLEEIRRLNLDGFTEAKLRKFGCYFLKVVNDMVKILKIDDSSRSKKIKDILDEYPLPNNTTINSSAGISSSFVEFGLSVFEICKKRSLQMDTVRTHLIAGIKAGYTVKLSDVGVTKEVRDAIVKVIKKLISSTKVDIADLTATIIKANCSSIITFDEIKAVLAYMQVRYHLEILKIPYEEFEDFKFDEIKNIQTEGSGSNALGIPTPQLEDKENVIEETCSEEPPRKKEKSDNDHCLIFDSPPRAAVSVDDVEVAQEAEVVEENTPVIVVPAQTQKKAKKDKVLPPWLTAKKIN